MSEIMNIKYSTGIPRWGTTLCCRILNECPNTIALHEPISPNTLISKNSVAAVTEIVEISRITYTKLRQGAPLNHGDSSLLLDNPIEDTNAPDKLRQVKARRGQIHLPAQREGTLLIIKQNALFTSLLSSLATQTPVTAIVRNPVPVILSWMSVNLPVNQGRIPAAERFDPKLKAELDALPLIQRYAKVYNWFIERFISNGVKIVRYEDIVASQGGALTVELTGESVPYSMISPPQPVNTKKRG